MTSNNAQLTIHSSSSSLSSSDSSSTSASSSAFGSLPATIESDPTTLTNLNDQDAEQPVCRVCRSDDPSLGPLFHPCRCTGSIAHVHQDCLSTWLSHSKKSSCELCAHPFSFEKVYKSGSPDRPPIPTIIFQASKEVLRLILLIGRATLVAMCWLGLVPWTVVWVSAAYWRLGDWFAFGLTSGNDLKFNQTLNQTSDTLNSTNSTDLQLTSNSSNSNSSNPTNLHNSFSLLSIHFDTNSIAMDIFQGQLITCAVILSFVAVFLLREWILQNTPPNDVMHLEEDDAQNLPLPPAEGINNRQAQIEDVDQHADYLAVNDNLDRIIPPTPRPPINFNEEVSIASSDSDSSDAIFHQFSTESDSLLHDDSDLTDSSDLDQSLNFDLLSHQVLITSVYLIFIAEPTSHQFTPPSDQSGATTPMQTELVQTWTKLASALSDPYIGTLPFSVSRLRQYIRRQPTSGPFSKDEETMFNLLETDWTTALLSDPKIAKHIQSLYRIKLDANKTPLTDVFHHHALVYGLLTLFNLIKGLELVNEGDQHSNEDTSRPYLTVFNALKLFVVPLLGAMGSIDIHPCLNQLELDIQKLAETYQVLPSGEVGDDSVKLIKDMKRDLVSMLVKQRILGAVMGTGAFVKYAQDILCKQNLLSKESSVLQISKVESTPGGPDDRFRSIDTPKRNPLTVTPPLPPTSFNQEMSDLPLPTSVNHRLLVTSAYLLLLPPTYNAFLPPALQTMNMLNKFPVGWKEENITGLWSKFATSMILSDENKNELKGFRQYISRVSKFSSSALARSFQKLEIDWLTIFLNDELIINFASTIYESEGNKLIHQLIDTYDKLKSLLVPNEGMNHQIRYESLHGELNHAVEVKLGECSSAQLQKGVFEVVRSTQFLLESCKALPTAVGSTTQDSITRSIDRVIRMRRGILGILARHQLLYRIVKHEGFGRYATAMLMNEDFLEVDDVGMTLKVLPSDQSDVVDNNANKEKDVKGKSKEIEPPVAGPSSSTTLPTSTSHTDAFDWLEVGEELPKANESNPNRSQPTNGPGTPHPTVDRVVRPIPPRNQPRRFMLPPPVGNRVQQAPIPPLQVAPVLDRRHLAMMQARLNEFDQAQNLDRNNRLQPNAIGPVNMAVAPPPAAAAAAAPDDEVEEELLAEDLDGILELIGMKGSLLMLVQNVGLMTLLLSLSILAFVHIPHMIGKIAVLSRAHRLLAPPLKGLLILRKFVHLSLDYVSVHLKRQLTRIDLDSRFSLSRFIPVIKTNSDSVEVIPWTPSWLTHRATSYLQSGVHYLQSQLYRIISLSPIWHQLIDQLGERLERIAYGSKPLDRALAVLLGYTELVFLSLIYLSSGLDQQRARFVSETIVNGMKQQVMITKVGTFIFIELVIFPFLCGFLINLTTIPVFPNTTISNRLELYSASPYSTVLITWLAGTCFMFTFAILVSTCRESLRSGVCWWIRDPSDDRFNPIREILERPAWSQVKKILASALMYGSVIALGIGSIVMSLMIFTGCLPLRVHLDRSISNSAIDLIIYQTGLPIFIYWIQPRTQLKKSLQHISRKVAKSFRLSCFLYGEREIEEETKLEVVIRMPGRSPILKKPRAWYSFIRFFEDDQYHLTANSEQIESLEEIQPGTTIERRRKPAGGSFARVPGTDSVKVVPGRKMHIPVLANGIPIDPADEILITQQKAEARAETGREVDHYTVVYLPPCFRLRMIGYVVSMWSIGVMFGWIGIGIPLMMGRVLLDRVIMINGREPHDIYAYGIGSVVVAIIGRIAKKIVEAYWKEEVEELEVKEKIQWIKKLNQFGNLVGFSIGVGLVLPILLTGLIELYILGPLKPKGLEIPTIYLVQSWAYGCIYLSIGARLIRVIPNWVSRAQDEVMVCWNRGEIYEGIQIANSKIILPLTIKMILGICLPTGILGPILLIIPERNLKFMMRLAGWNSLKKGECIYLMLRSVYPAILSWYSHYLTSRICAKGIGRWIERVRDEKFLEERRLKNYDAEDEERNGTDLKKQKKKKVDGIIRNE
ncbi:hypothetical protein DFH28DRAFT_950559 [Melampsora americana]|nr:hypothetical protein DFH28DRAFT_950559 [Melampsora americana]